MINWSKCCQGKYANADDADEAETAKVDEADDAGAVKTSAADEAHVTDEAINTDEAEANEANEAEADEADEADVDNESKTHNAKMKLRFPRLPTIQQSTKVEKPTMKPTDCACSHSPSQNIPQSLRK
jgi:hypothetical protein